MEDIVQRLKERHGRMAAAKYNADSDVVPQRLLMPGVNDPSLWTVRVKVVSQICQSDARLIPFRMGEKMESSHPSSERSFPSNTLPTPSMSSPSSIATLCPA